MELAQRVSLTVGTMEPLPEWILEGCIIGIVGGQDYVDEKYAYMKSFDLPMNGIWMQDWVGQHEFNEGTRLLWNWQLNTEHYYNWTGMVDAWAQDGVKPLIYINPYIANLTSFDVPGIRQDQFAEGIEGGFFVKNTEGETYLINSISI
jgi:sulfoquinovosidase